MGGNETEIDFVLVDKNNRKHLKDVKAIPWELQYRVVVTDIDKRKLQEGSEERTNYYNEGLEVEGKQHKSKISRKI